MLMTRYGAPAENPPEVSPDAPIIGPARTVQLAICGAAREWADRCSA
jgi:hypothetical protein